MAECAKDEFLSRCTKAVSIYCAIATGALKFGLVNGRRIEQWINGVKVFDADLESPELSASMAAQFRPGIPKPAHLDELKNDKAKAYPIVLTHHGGDAWFGNIRIREPR